MIKVKDGYAKLIGTTYQGSATQVLLSNGGNLEYSSETKANTLVQRNASQHIYATYFNSAISDEALTDIGSVYVRNTSDTFIRRISKNQFYSIIDNKFVTLDTAQTITGVKTFSASPILTKMATIIQNQDSTSSYTQVVRWLKGGTSQGTYNPSIGQHNTGGDGTGSICILPYPTEYNPWSGDVGLFITKDHVYIDGKELANKANGSVYFTEFNGGGITSSGNTLTQANHSITIGGQTRTAGASTCNIINSLSVSTITSSAATNLILGITVNGVVSTNKAIPDLYATFIHVKDVRGETRQTTYWESNTANFWFNNTGTPSPSWYSGITIKGWTDDYQTWELASGSNMSLNGNLYYRNGLNGTWQNWQRIIFASELPGLFTDFSNAGSQTTSISIGGTTKTLKIDADTVDGLHASDFQRTWIGYAGKTYIGWIKIIEWTLTRANHFSPYSFILQVYRNYASPSSESYTLAFNFGWDSANIVQLNSNRGSRIIENFRVTKTADGLKYFVEMYVNTSYTTHQNTCYFAIGNYTSFTGSLVCAIQSETVTELCKITTSPNNIVAPGYVKQGSQDSYVLLGGGGHKAISDFATSEHNHDNRYVQLNGSSVMSGNLVLSLKDVDRFIVFSYPATINPTSNSWRTGVLGSGEGEANYYVVQYQKVNMDSSTWNTAFRIGQTTGNVTFTNNITIGDKINYHAGNLTPKTVILSTSAQTYLIAGDTNYTLQMPSTDPYTSARIPTAHTHYATTYKDSRNEAMTPTQGVAVNGIAIDFKTKANGVAGSGTYCGLVTFDPYSDVSGGYPLQLGFNTGADSTNTNDVYIRTAKDSNTWNAWRTIINNVNYTTYTVTKDGTGATGTWGINITGNAASATKLTSSAGNAALPIYFSDGKPVACTASSIFSNLSNDGNNISITVAGQNRTLTVNYANAAGYTQRLYANSISNLTTHPGDYSLAYSRFQAGVSNIFPTVNNANGVITTHLHYGNYFAQIGLSSDGRMYYRTMMDQTLDAGVTWNKVAFTSDIPTKVSQLTNDSGFITGGPYLPLSGGTMNQGSHVVFPGTSTDASYGGSIEFREVNYVATNQTDWSYAPGITFHWGGRSVGKLGLRSDGDLAWRDQSIIHSGNINSQSVNYANSANKLNKWFSSRIEDLNQQFGDGALRIFNSTSSTTANKCPSDSSILHLAWDNNNGYDSQLALDAKGNNIYFRGQNGGTWSPWKTVLHNGNSSISGNTITINGSSITVSKSDHTHSYLPLTGGTLSGNLTVGQKDANRTISIAGNTSHLKMIAHTNATYIESGNKDWNGNTPLLVTGYSGSQGSSLYLYFANIYCRSNGNSYVNLDSGNWSNYITIPTATSQLTNDSGFLTSRGYIGKTAVQATATAQSLTGICNITPETANTYYLGASDKPWYQIFGKYFTSGSISLYSSQNADTGVKTGYLSYASTNGYFYITANNIAANTSGGFVMKTIKNGIVSQILLESASDYGQIRTTGDLYIGGRASNTTALISSDAAHNMYISVQGKALLVCDSSENSIRRGRNQVNNITLGTGSCPWKSLYVENGVKLKGKTNYFSIQAPNGTHSSDEIFSLPYTGGTLITTNSPTMVKGWATYSFSYTNGASSTYTMTFKAGGGVNIVDSPSYYEYNDYTGILIRITSNCKDTSGGTIKDSLMVWGQASVATQSLQITKATVQLSSGTVHYYLVYCKNTSGTALTSGSGTLNFIYF